MVITWSKPAKDDLRLIYQYIARDSKRYANRVIQDILAKVEPLGILPGLGTIVPELDEENVREISIYSYRIIYEIIGEMIYVHAVIHKRRNIKSEDLLRE